MAKKQTKRRFRGVWIPSEIWLSSALTPREKLFLIEIDSLDNDDRGCFASNRHFAGLFYVTRKSASRIIRRLVEKELVISEIDHPGGNKRALKIADGILRPYPPKCPEPLSPQTSIGYPPKCPEAIPTNGDRAMDVCGDTYNNTNTNNQMSNQVNTNNIVSFSELGLALELEEKLKIEAVKYELQIQLILPARSNGERTTYNRLREHIIKLILGGKRDKRVFPLVIGWAREAREVTGNPRAIWIAKCKQELGFKGKGKRLLKQRGGG